VVNMSNTDSTKDAIDRCICFWFAGYLSWITHKSVAWALFHAITGGFYILYWMFEYGSK
jgi:hypothetical protein